MSIGLWRAGAARCHDLTRPGNLQVGLQTLRLHRIGVGSRQQVAGLRDVGDVLVDEVIAVLLLRAGDDVAELGNDGLGHLAELLVAHLRAQLLPEVLALADGLHHHGWRLFLEPVRRVAELVQELALAVLTEEVEQRSVQVLALLFGQAVIGLVHRDGKRRVVRIVGDKQVLAADAVDHAVGQRACAGLLVDYRQGLAHQASHRAGQALRIGQV